MKTDNKESNPNNELNTSRTSGGIGDIFQKKEKKKSKGLIIIAIVIILISSLIIFI